jgi:class 3 adenylate cyclase
MKRVSAPLKLVLAAAVSFIFVSAVVGAVSSLKQRAVLLDARESSLLDAAVMLTMTIRSDMLNGGVQRTAATLNSLQAAAGFQEADVFRTDGSRAFHDDLTLEAVNKYIGRPLFKRTPRLPDKSIDGPGFRKVLMTDLPVRVDLRKPAAMEYYFPIMNLPDCWGCHGAAADLRGVAYFSVSTANVRERVRSTGFFLIAVLVILGILAGTGWYFLLRRRASLSSISSGEKRGLPGTEAGKSAAGMRKNLAVVFADMKTLARDTRDEEPSGVIELLDGIVRAQAGAVAECGGIIGRSGGETFMAVFPDEYDAVRCAYRMIRAVRKIGAERQRTLSVGIGIDAGSVVTGTIGSESVSEPSVVGPAVTAASRLSMIAGPNMILISDAVLRKVGERVRVKRINTGGGKGSSAGAGFSVVHEVMDTGSRTWVR